MYELYEQLLPTRVYYSKKTRTGPENEIMCRLCGKAAESVGHILTGCSALAQSKYLQCHNAVLKILFFEMLYSLDLIYSVLPWYSPTEPKPVNENDRAKAFWDVPVYADHVEVRANRIDARIVDNSAKTVIFRLYACQKTHTSLESEAWCRLCGKAPESVAHILSGCGALAQSKYLSRQGTFLRDVA